MSSLNSVSGPSFEPLGKDDTLRLGDRVEQYPDLAQHFNEATQINRESQNVPKGQEQKNYKKLIKDAHGLIEDSRTMSEGKLRLIYDIIFQFAGKTSLTPPFCSMCLNPGTLANSHIIPNNILAGFGTSFVINRTPNEPKSAAKMTSKLFCTPKCEVDRLSKLGENGFSQIFHSFMEDVKMARKDKISASLVTSDQSVHYCVASIVFRNMVVNGKQDLKAWIYNHGPEVEEDFWRFFFLLRNYVLDKDNPKRPHIQFYLDEIDFERNALTYSICTITANPKGKWYTTGHFGFKGFHFLVVESKEFLTTFKKYTTLPPNGFSETITFEPQTIVVNPQHVLKLPYVVSRVFQFDLPVYQATISRLNPNILSGQNSPSTTGIPQVRVPIHPLVTDPVAFYNSLPFVMRLPDEILFHRNVDQTGRLEFHLSDKYEIVFTRTESTGQIWLVRNIPRKQIFAVINHFAIKRQVVCGFSLDQNLFRKKDFEGAKKVSKSLDSDENALKNYLGLTPLDKTVHLNIEYMAESHEIQRFILGAVMRYWHSQG